MQKCLAGMAAGVWVCKPSFIDALLRDGAAADPAPHEQAGGMPGGHALAALLRCLSRDACGEV